MRRRFASAIALGLLLGGLLALQGVPALASQSHSVGKPSQIAWVRSAASRFLTAELQGNGSAACSILNARLRATRDHHSCTQRWDAKLAAVLRTPAARSHLRADRHALPTATIVVNGYQATVELPTPLMNGASRFVWSENCWMLTR